MQSKQKENNKDENVKKNEMERRKTIEKINKARS